jgi:hypothetical protein
LDNWASKDDSKGNHHVVREKDQGTMGKRIMTRYWVTIRRLKYCGIEYNKIKKTYLGNRAAMPLFISVQITI